MCEIKDLKDLKQISLPNDITISWWDYGKSVSKFSNTSIIGDKDNHKNSDYDIANIFKSQSSETIQDLIDNVVQKYFTTKEDAGNIYLYFPYRMLNIFSTILSIANKEALDKSVKRKSEFYQFNKFKKNNGVLILDSYYLHNIELI